VCILSSKKNKGEEQDFAGAAGGTQNLSTSNRPTNSQKNKIPTKYPREI
jgi:hypothetical protein